jgi:protein SCO1
MNKFLFFSALVFFCSCNSTPQGKLNILGERQGIDAKGDTIYATVPAFSFINQDSQVVSDKTFDNKLYIVDFFFTSCPTICPKVTAQMLRVHDRFKDNAKVLLLSHTIDVRHDTIARLRNYAQKIGIKNSSKWHFVTGDEDKIYAIANKYFSVAKKDPNSPGGFDHSGRLILVDSKKCIRSYCEGTKEEDVDRFMKDITRLIEEEAKQ